MVAGANGEPGLNALFHVVVESNSEDACVIIRLHRVAEEAAWVMLSSKEPATRTCAQSQWARGCRGLSGLRARSAAVEGSSTALVSAALQRAAASVIRARSATPTSASRWAALLAGCTGSVNEEKVVLSAALRSAAGRDATLTAVRKAATVPCTPTNTVDSAYRSVHVWWIKSCWPLCRASL